MTKPCAFCVLIVSLLPISLLSAESPASSSGVLQPFIERDELAGAVALVADKNKILAIDAVGYADIAANRAMRTDSLFWIASQSKGMTAVAVLMLVDEGKLSLDDPVVKYLPEFDHQMVIAEKTDRQLLLSQAPPSDYDSRGS